MIDMYHMVISDMILSTRDGFVTSQPSLVDKNHITNHMR